MRIQTTESCLELEDGMCVYLHRLRCFINIHRVRGCGCGRGHEVLRLRGSELQLCTLFLNGGERILSQVDVVLVPSSVVLNLSLDIRSKEVLVLSQFISQQDEIRLEGTTI